MGNSFININIHIIFHIKSTGRCLKEEDLSRIFQYIGGLIRAMSGHVYIVGGRPDHIHILTSLPSAMSLADFVRNIKANTSKWIKSLDAFWYHSFAWQEGYGAFSVSESKKNVVMNYIALQKEHHHHQTTQEEFALFLKKNKIEICTEA